MQHRLPTVTGGQEYVEAGFLIGYLKTAKLLGIVVPSDLAFRADHLIQ